MPELTRTVTAALVACTAATLIAAKLDARLATVHKAVVLAADELSDAQPVARCLAQHLASTTPLELVGSRADADVVLTITRAHLPGNTARAVFGGLGKVYLTASLPDGTALWSGDAEFSSMHDSHNVDIACNLADSIAGKLRDAMRKARDTK